MIFVIISFSFLVTALWTSYIFFPRKFSLWEQFLATYEDPKKEKQNFFQRLMDPGRSLPASSSSTQSRQANKAVKLKESVRIENFDQTRGPFNLSKEHLILRENILFTIDLIG